MALDQSEFPLLDQDGYEPKSPPAKEYNCIAYAAGVEDEWWEPGCVWPDKLDQNDITMRALITMFGGKGFEVCVDGSLEPGYDKIALYGTDEEYEHAALQLADGRWTSKLGKGQDIIHPRPESVGGGLYGQVRRFMKRRKLGAE